MLNNPRVCVNSQGALLVNKGFLSGWSSAVPTAKMFTESVLAVAAIILAGSIVKTSVLAAREGLGGNRLETQDWRHQIIDTRSALDNTRSALVNTRSHASGLMTLYTI